MNAVIIDDEENARINLSHLIEEFTPQLKVIGSFDSLEAARPILSNKLPDVLFLDIQMPHESGLNLWKYFPEPSFSVVFTTAFDQYALQAIRLSALDYLLKPIDIDELQRVANKITQQSKSLDVEKRLSALEANMNCFNPISQLVLSMTNSLVIIKIFEIVRCEGDNNYTHFFLKDGTKYTASKTLKEYENILPSSIFLRIHKSHLINLTFAKKYIKGKKSDVEMIDGSVVPVSNDKKDLLINMLTTM